MCNTQALRNQRDATAGKIVLAVPVAPEDALEELRKEVDEIIYLSAPSPFLAVGAHYADFGQLADAGVISLLEQRHRAMARSGDRTKRMKPAFRRSIQPKLAGLETLKLPNSAGD